MKDYRKERLEVIRRSINGLVELLTLNVTQLERIPFKNLQNMEIIIQEFKNRALASHRECSDSYICANDDDSVSTTS